MCLEDYTIQRQLRTTLYATSGGLVIPANPNRVACVLTCSDTSIATLTTPVMASIGGEPAQAIPLAVADRTASPSLGQVILRLADYGNVLTGELELGRTGDTGTVFLVDVYLEIETPYTPVLTKLPK